MKKYYLVIDLGASNGRGIVFSFDGTTLKSEEEFRFPNGIVRRNGADRWDFAHLLTNVRRTIAAAAAKYPLRSLALDTWGLDYGLLDRNGNLLEEPYSYRDVRTAGIPEKVETYIDARRLYEITGIQRLQGNTLYQLYAHKCRDAELLDRAGTLLMMPDLLTYFLTGECHAEYTVSTTTQMLDIHTGKWSDELLTRLALPRRLFPELIYPGKQAFPLRNCGVNGLNLVTAASHDTASAVAAVPTGKSSALYVSSGTWSILGTELTRPLICDTGYAGNFANEGGIDGTIRYCSSQIGLWLLQECVRNWGEKGQYLDYRTLDMLAREAQPFRSVFDPRNPRVQERCDMPAVIARLCRENGTVAPETHGEYCRCIYEAIALNYRRTISTLESLTGKRYDCLYVIGGGARADFLNRCIADATGKIVIAGMPEATAYGNVYAQLLYDGEIAGLSEFRTMLESRETLHSFSPRETASWDDAYARFLRLCDKDRRCK